MTRTSEVRHRHVTGAGLSADVRVDDDGAHVSFTVNDHRVPAADRAEAVTRVLNLPELRAAGTVHAALPLGQPEILWCLEREFVAVRKRVAGVTCLVDAEVVRS